jgi:NAD(P)-dependent dehydrogenase (short-subunit alcohol dehydrogenase family)
LCTCGRDGSVGLRSDPTYAWYGAGETANRTSKAAMNMLAACQHFEDGPRGEGVAFNPGYVVTNLCRTGEGRQERWDRGGGCEGECEGLVDIVLGRDGDVGKFVHKDGEHPW